MKDGVAISVVNVSKSFRLPHEKADSVKSLFVNPFNKNRRRFEVQRALRDITFDIKKGEFFGIVGRNGSGKSTLLKIIAGIYQTSKGTVSVSGRLVPFIELGVGFNPELTGRENVYLNGAMLGFSEKEVDEKISSIIDFAELERFMDQKLKNYSSGMQVRLAFSIATVLADSDVLLIDEVLAVGDASFQRKCYEYFKQLKKDKKTVVFVSHDMSAIREYCDRAVLIDNNKVVAIGKTDDVAQKYTRLFTDTTEVVVGKESTRWGKGGIETAGVSVSTTDKIISVEQRVMSSVKTTSPIVGIRIRSAAGDDIMGTNTKVEQIDTGVFMPGHERVVVWTMPNVLADGDYYVDPAIVDADGITVHDWWDEAIKFSITKDRRLPYSVDPGFNVEVKNK